jgi:uncharacterized membrane protein
MIFGREPVLIMGAIQALLGLAIAFEWVKWTETQTGAVIAVAAAVLSVIVRQQVTPVQKLKKATDQTKKELRSLGAL